MPTEDVSSIPQTINSYVPLKAAQTPVLICNLSLIEPNSRAEKKGSHMQKFMAVAMLLILAAGQGYASDLFSNPKEVCSSLHSEGLAAGNWKASKTFEGEWLCMTSLTPFGPNGSNGMENNIAFYVNGTKPDRADDIRIKININNPNRRGQAFDKLISATESLFKAIAEPIPVALSNALKQQNPTKFTADFGQVELILEPGRIDSYKVVLTDAKFLSAKEKKRNSSAGNFDLCKQMIAKKVSYSVSALTGDGNPIDEAGYQSFYLQGQSDDLFFCEVHPGKRYKIKAALGGSFPFKYIDDGRFE